MNVGIVTTWYERGAAYVSRQLRDTLEERHEVFIYARRGGDKHAAVGPDWAAPRVTEGKEPEVHFLTAVDESDFCRWLVNNRIEIVLFNEQRWWMPILWCRRMGIKTGAYVDYYTKETVELYGIYDFLICNTRRHYSVFASHCQCFYIPWGTDLEIFRPAGNDFVIDGKVTFFHSAGMSPGRKGTDLLLEAFAKLHSPSRLIIHTQVELEACFPEQAPLLMQLQQEDRLEIIVKTIPAPGLYALGGVYVYPSRLDGIGLTLVEAMACGLPVITTDAPPMNEFVSEENGKLVAVERFAPRSDGYYWPQAFVSIQSLADAMHYYVVNADRLPLFRQAARSSAERHFNWRENSAGLCRILENVRARSGRQMREAEQLVDHFERRRGGNPEPAGEGIVGKIRSLVRLR